MLSCARAALELKLVLHLEQLKADPFPVEARVADMVAGNETDYYLKELGLKDGRRCFVVECPQCSAGRHLGAKSSRSSVHGGEGLVFFQAPLNDPIRTAQQRGLPGRLARL